MNEPTAVGHRRVKNGVWWLGPPRVGWGWARARSAVPVCEREEQSAEHLLRRRELG